MERTGGGHYPADAGQPLIVVDASAVVELLATTPVGREVGQRIREERLLHAPHLLDLEVINAMRRQTAIHSLGADRVDASLTEYRNLRILRHPHHPYVNRVWEYRHQFSAYDACYLALTEAFGATLLTCDGALKRARLSRGRVELVAGAI